MVRVKYIAPLTALTLVGATLLTQANRCLQVELNASTEGGSVGVKASLLWVYFAAFLVALWIAARLVVKACKER